MVVIASISVSFAAIVAAGTLVVMLAAGALIFLAAQAGDTARRIRRFTDADRTFSQRVDAAIDAHRPDRRPPRT